MGSERPVRKDEVRHSRAAKTLQGTPGQQLYYLSNDSPSRNVIGSCVARQSGTTGRQQGPHQRVSSSWKATCNRAQHESRQSLSNKTLTEPVARGTLLSLDPSWIEVTMIVVLQGERDIKK